MSTGVKVLLSVVALQVLNTALMAGIFWIFWKGGWW
jgi:hypothetical protein